MDVRLLLLKGSMISVSDSWIFKIISSIETAKKLRKKVESWFFTFCNFFKGRSNLSFFGLLSQTLFVPKLITYDLLTPTMQVSGDFQSYFRYKVTQNLTNLERFGQNFFGAVLVSSNIAFSVVEGDEDWLKLFKCHAHNIFAFLIYLGWWWMTLFAIWLWKERK